MIKKQNQEFPITPKKKRVDSVGNDKRKLYFKSGGATITLIKSLTENQAKIIENVVHNIVEDLHLKLEGTFIWKP